MDSALKMDDNMTSESVLFPPDLSPAGFYIITDLRRKYEELNKVAEFEPLKDWQLFFVWMVWCPCSPYVMEGHTEQRRIQYGLDITMKKSATEFKSFASRDLYEKYMNQEWGEDVSAAIVKMQAFDPSLRMKAAAMTAKIMADYEEIIRKPLPTDNDEIKKRVDIMSKISEDLERLVKKGEESFGIKTVTKIKSDNKSMGSKSIDKVFEVRKRRT